MVRSKYDILKDAGKISHEIALKLVEEEFGKFRVIQDRSYESDFDEEVKKIESKFKGYEKKMLNELKKKKKK